MTHASGVPSEQEAALARFDAARDAFLEAFAQAPDEALAYVPTGEEYAVGTLLEHLNDPMRRYMNVFHRIRRADFGLVDLAADAERTTREEGRHAELVAMRPTGADRERLLAQLRATHQEVCGEVGALDEAAFVRQAPVIYSAGAQPYPTAYRDIMGWLVDHYEEHTAHVADLLRRWESESR